MDSALPIAPRRIHLRRLMSLWRSAGWPCRDAVELDLLAAGWTVLAQAAGGHETIRLTDAGIRLLADSRQRNRRSLSAHDQLAARVAVDLMATGRIVWRELSLRAWINANDPSSVGPVAMIDGALWPQDEAVTQHSRRGHGFWRMARPDVFSVRRTSVEDYLHPMVHEVKVSRADLLSDLRHTAKCESYRWLSCETYYVFPVGVAAPHEIPQPFGIWLLDGSVDSGTLSLVRPAQHVHCKLPFPVWMALAQATPASTDAEAAQQELGDLAATSQAVAGKANAALLHKASDA